MYTSILHFLAKLNYHSLCFYFFTYKRIFYFDNKVINHCLNFGRRFYAGLRIRVDLTRIRMDLNRIRMDLTRTRSYKLHEICSQYKNQYNSQLVKKLSSHYIVVMFVLWLNNIEEKKFDFESECQTGTGSESDFFLMRIRKSVLV